MKKIGALYQVAFFALLMLSVIIFSGIAQAATTTMDGFVGVPWGADNSRIIEPCLSKMSFLTDI